jgi:hypothetical protein
VPPQGPWAANWRSDESIEQGRVFAKVMLLLTYYENIPPNPAMLIVVGPQNSFAFQV